MWKVIIPPERGERELRTAPQVPERATWAPRADAADSGATLLTPAQDSARAKKQEGIGGSGEEEGRAEHSLVNPESHEAVSEIHAHALEHEPSGRIRSQVGEEDRARGEFRCRPRSDGRA